MSNSFRIRTQVGVDKSIKVNLTQDFEFLEILSLKLLQNEIYTRQCADYGVVIGRISINNGFGLPNCRVSIFIPLTSQDATNPIISELYPYKSLSDVNDDGYRYNLLPYTKSYSAHVPTGTFFDKEDVLINQSYIEVFDKYYRYTAITNDSGDFMIFGVPLGVQTIHVDVDLSDIGEFSLAPQDLIRTGLATEAQVAGTRFKASNNLNELPQIISINRIINVEPLWGQPEICEIGINRTDFDLSAESNVVIEPTAIFMGSIFSDTDNLALKRNCKPKVAQGELCSLVAGPGEILAIRQTIDNDVQGRPILEQFELESGGQVIDENGTWLLDLPMNLDYVTTNEFGERVISNDPEVGIPTRGKYRFKIKWNQSPKLDENVKRGYFLVPNVREYGWVTSNDDPLKNYSPGSPEYDFTKKSYAFSLDWNDYADPNTAIRCEDTFYQFSYNKVYTISQLIDQYRKGTLANKIISVKNILDNSCESENNKFPTNDASFRWDFIFLLYTFASYVFRPVLIALVPVLHILFFLIILLRTILIPLLTTYLFLLLLVALPIKIIGAAAGVVSAGMVAGFIAEGVALIAAIAALIALNIELNKMKLKGINLPLLLYDQCEFCPCEDADELSDEGVNTGRSNVGQALQATPNASGLQLVNFEGGQYNTDKIEDNSNYIGINYMLSGFFTQRRANKIRCYSKVPIQFNGIYSSTTVNTSPARFFTRSITIAERINLFNIKAKYFDDNVTNPGGGVNQVYVSVAPTLNGGGYVYNNDPNQSYLIQIQKYHTDNIIAVMMTADSLSYLSGGTILSFASPASTKDINYTGGTLNQFGNNAITGTSSLSDTTLNSISVQHTLPNGNTRTTQYTIPIISTGNTNFHKFPIDIEYYQVITAMTYSQYDSLSVTNQLSNSLKQRFLDNDMRIMVYQRATTGNQDTRAYEEFINPLKSLDEYEKQVVVFLVRGVDPYSTRVETRYDMGKLFGYYDPTEVSFSGLYKLNIPIQGGFKNVRHTITNQFDIDSYSNSKLYYDTYDYVPKSSALPNGFSGFQSNLIHYYSSLDSTITDFNAWWYNCSNNFANTDYCSWVNFTSNSNGLLVTNQPIYNPSGSLSQIFNEFTTDWTDKFNFTVYYNLERWGIYVPTPPPVPPFPPFNYPSNPRGYFMDEIIEGGSVMTIYGQPINDSLGNSLYVSEIGKYQLNDSEGPKYLSPMYSSATTMNFNLFPNGRQIIMRSDRLPTSDKIIINCTNSYALQQNQNLGIYIIPDEGTLNVPFDTGGISIGSQENDDLLDPPKNFTAELLATTNSCENSRNLECYSFTANTTLRDGITEPGGGRYGLKDVSCQKFDGKFIFEKGCYKLVTTVFGSLFKDIRLVTEWLSRTNVTFGACRNIFSHLFTHNWVNGSLYAFAFKNNRVLGINGKLTSKICSDVVFFDQDTNNFFYRSSPYTTGGTDGFIGKEALTSPNRNNLLFPTTIMDLGPRNDYIQELVYSDEYDGYVINQLRSTSYQDVSELLNLLIITRLANTSVISILIGANGGSIFEYFERPRITVDADYAQTISVNSELGVVPFEAESYPSIDLTDFYTTSPPPNAFTIDPVYFNTGEFRNVIFGIFYSSDTQVRDFITPKRTIINGQVQANNNCAFNNFYCYSQEVPFYQWEIKSNSNVDSIFGSQKNNWDTTPIGNRFLKSKYQSMDRVNPLSRYFRTDSSSSTYVEDDKGYIFSRNTRTWVETPIPPPATDSIFWTPDSYNPLITGQDSNNNPESRIITVGAPFYFYFGLKKGKSAWDRFAKKWINFENIN